MAYISIDYLLQVEVHQDLIIVAIRALLITKNHRSETSNIYVTAPQKVSMPNLFVAALQIKQ